MSRARKHWLNVRGPDLSAAMSRARKHWLIVIGPDLSAVGMITLVYSLSGILVKRRLRLLHLESTEDNARDIEVRSKEFFFVVVSGTRRVLLLALSIVSLSKLRSKEESPSSSFI
ncbi:unnamed protein product [Microthlaspi erraticum]|uniref:Uncharacterized protein n=1 Tax=Microthlaspi erraticum TaxID=1685480 RepID=A0A6D2IWC3_9BRAS|nr:unnamed protein product [Microthlaspi erraticum]